MTSAVDAPISETWAHTIDQTMAAATL